VFVRSWLKDMRIDRSPTIQLVPLAISQLLDLLKDGFIQGICCAEPIGQIALETDLGVTVARSRNHSPLPMQSVLVTTDAFCAAHPNEAKAIASAVDRARAYCANPKNEAEILRIYRKQMLNKPTPALGGAGQHPALATLIGFEPGSVNGQATAKDLINSLATACATLPGVISAEREIRDTVRAIFSDVL
jgi:ABC-type nitrate/sulfonate/bicarbonate transport system substrate-binding protein